MEAPNPERERIFDAFRHWGYLEADLDPLGLFRPQPQAELQIENEYAREARHFYCGTIGVEFMHITEGERRRWIQERMEAEPGSVDQQRVLELLIRADTFEQVLQQRYLGTKRFSLEGNTALLPLVDEILEELELTPHRATRIGKLPPEARRCTSIAIELIARPTLLVVDEPSAGLDAAQENHVMAMLRRQADIGCVVVVAINSQTSLTHVSMCDQVLVLTAAGTMAFAGTPLQVEPAMGTHDWSKVLAQARADPDGVHRAFRARQQALGPAAPPEVTAPWPLPAGLGAMRQIRLVAGRQVRLLFADRAYLLFLAFLPFVLAALTLLIPGDSGLDKPHPSSHNMHEAIEILAALNIAAVIIGTALTIRDLVAERRVFRREQAVGLSAPAYVAGKIIFFSVAAAILTAIVFTIVMVVKGGPAHGAVVLQNATVELYVTVAVTAIVSAIIGLAMSALAKSVREVLPLLLPVILASLLFNGSLVQLVSKWGLQQISWFVPAQWGFAASASTVDLRRVDALAANAEMWTHYSGWWVFDMIMLIAFGVIAAAYLLYRLRAPKAEIRSPITKSPTPDQAAAVD